MIIYCVFINGVFSDLYEVVEMDGVGLVCKFFSIMLFFICFLLIFIFVMIIVGLFNVFGQLLMMIDGGLQQIMYVFMMYICQFVFGFGELVVGMVFVMVVLLGLVILVIFVL